MDEASDSMWMSKQNEAILKDQFPLHCAIRDGNMETAISLLNSGRFDLFEEDGFYGWTPVHWAAHFGKLESLTQLLKHGASFDVPTHRFNQTPAHIAASASQLLCLKWLLHFGATLNRQDFMGETPLHKAARSGSMECVSLLVSQGCNLGLRNHNGHTSAELASLGGFRECASELQKSQQFQEQAMASNTPAFNFNNNNNQPSANPEGNEKSEHCCNGGIEQFVKVNQANGDVDMSCDMDVIEDQGNKLHVNGHSVQNGVHASFENGFGGLKRGRDDIEEENFKRRRCGDILHAAARVIPPCSMDQGVSPNPNPHLASNRITTATMATPNQDIPVKCLALHSHMI